MPEGDTIHKLAAVLAPELLGERIERLWIRHRSQPTADHPRITRVTSKGKHLFIQLDDGLSIRTHLGLYGSWHRYWPREPWQKPERQASLVLGLEKRIYVCFNAKEVELTDAEGFHARDQRARLGPDLTRDPPHAEVLEQRLAQMAQPDTLMVDLMLDQRIASGIGNVYKSEVLFLQGVPPLARLRDVPLPLTLRLYETAARLLRDNLSDGPRVTRKHQDGRGRLWVYKRSGLPCLHCGVPIVRQMLGRNPRSTYWCPSCQTSAPGQPQRDRELA
ncbi:Fpg/Nei family DNA glycosylase [Thiorhodococcus mannitoliphagus]|uniref:DNA-(apurinic or apyrimidinic site) lyase n=1 Tax=Thiorhodococcus mannitoliphagus TaxID=329406 RepID=A0A6P1DSA2_9GAMM|nr:DNA-formamidopyrimidine glycosylase family protein [Thiorhodococcus mannitoliphagus]NEX21157.1 Fpg/Nei family DNA glycosylase [Thiorhodococcus mannitoliphagus]